MKSCYGTPAPVPFRIGPAGAGEAEDCRGQAQARPGPGDLSSSPIEAFKDSVRKNRSKLAPKLEHGAQVRLLKEVRRRGIPGLVVFAVPNAARRSANLARKLQAEGMRAGVSDLIFIIPPRGLTGCLEMKREKGGTVRDEQLRFRRDAIEAGALHGIANGFEQAVAVLESWGVLI